AVAVDLRAHGGSEAPPDGDYSIAACAEDIAAAVDGLKLERFVLVGHSMGGAASLLYAGKHPSRVAGLVLVGTPGKTPPELASHVPQALATDYQKTMDDYMKTLLANARPEVSARVEKGRERLSPEQTVAMTVAIFRYDPTPALESYRGPMLFVNSPNDEQ